jgi:hypothetical protein
MRRPIPSQSLALVPLLAFLTVPSAVGAAARAAAAKILLERGRS